MNLKKLKYKRISLHIELRQLDKLKKIAKKYKVTVASLIREAIDVSYKDN